MDDEIALSPFALQALQQFYQEQQDQEEKFKKLEQIAESRFQGVQAEENTTIENVELEIADFKEDWQLSQFWYDDETATKLAKEAIRIAPKGGIICCISSPSAFMKLRALPDAKDYNNYVFEYDKRFGVVGKSYVYYDYSNPLEVPSDLVGKADVLVVDPPFLSEECWRKTAQTVKKLANPNAKIIVCTGAVMAGLILELVGAKEIAWRPSHKNGLSNEFRCYVNYDNPEF